MIFFAILASGGNLLLPKEILYAGFVLPALLLRYPTELLTKNHRIIWHFFFYIPGHALVGLAHALEVKIIGENIKKMIHQPN